MTDQTAPTIETERLLLRGHRLDDLDDLIALWSHPEVIRFIGGRPFTAEETWARLQRYVGHWTLSGYGFWSVREKGSDRHVGDCGTADFKRGLPLPFDGSPEAGWVIAPWAHGKGYASEAMTAILAWNDQTFARTVCIISPENTPSLRVAAKLGYREFGRAPYHGNEVIALERTTSRAG